MLGEILIALLGYIGYFLLISLGRLLLFAVLSRGRKRLIESARLEDGAFRYKLQDKIVSITFVLCFLRGIAIYFDGRTFYAVTFLVITISHALLAATISYLIYHFRNLELPAQDIKPDFSRTLSYRILPPLLTLPETQRAKLLHWLRNHQISRKIFGVQSPQIKEGK